MDFFGVDLIVFQKLNQHFIFFLFSQLVSNGLAMEVEAINVIGDKEEHVHHVIIEEIRQQNFLP